MKTEEVEDKGVAQGEEAFIGLVGVLAGTVWILVELVCYYKRPFSGQRMQAPRKVHVM